MNAPWEQNFDFYEGTNGDARAIIRVDLAAAEHAPVASHPVRLQFRVKMLEPREDGLRSEQEADALFKLEDTFVEAIVTAQHAIYVGRMVSRGYTEFVFYAPPEHRDAWSTLNDLNERVAPYEF